MLKMATTTVIIVLLSVLSVISERVKADEICFDDVGCFTDDGCHSHAFPPESPDEIGTGFFLYTRRNRFEPQQLVIDDVERLRKSHYDPKRLTKISIHGYTANAFRPLEQDQKDAFLEADDFNVILVDWSIGASGLYGKCRQNARVVGRQIALMVRFLNLETGMYYRDLHLIGMSLGAHVMGHAGEARPGIARITGLDPAGPLFRNDDFYWRNNGPECRLDPTDAVFVDVMHTDGHDVTGYGQMAQLGHQDFYPNGGRRQPGCSENDFQTGCSHLRALSLFADTIRATSCDYTATPCDSWARFWSGSCMGCGEDGCAVMGYRADTNTALTGKFYLETQSAAPYCVSTK